MRYHLCRIFIITALIFSGQAGAQESALTGGAIDKYLRSLQEMESMADTISAEDEAEAATMANLWLEGDTVAITEHIQDKEYYPELESAVKRAGFDSVNGWVATAQRVTEAFMAVEMGDQSAEAAAQMQAGLEQVRNSEQLSEAQKEALIEQLQKSQTQLANIESVSQADRRAIQPYMDKLRQHFEGDTQRQGAP